MTVLTGVRAMVAGFIVVVLLLPVAVMAHSNKIGTTPADGARLSAAPEMVGMTFDRPVRLTLLRMTDAAGTSHELNSRQGAPVVEFATAPGALPSGAYTVEWRGLSADGHPVKGSFSFVVE